MANTVITGLRWLKNMSGGNHCPRVPMPVASAYSTGIFRGDPVKRVSDGTIAAAANGDAVFGVADGAVQYKNSSGQIVSGNFLPASTTFTGDPVLSNPQASIVNVIPVLRQQFEGCVDTAAADIATAGSLVGNNFDTASAAGSTANGRSAYKINGASGFGTSTAQFRLFAIGTAPLNDVTAANWTGVFEANEGTEPSPTTATGT